MSAAPARIVKAVIRPEPAWENLGLAGGRMIVGAVFDDGEADVLFGFYDDELTFTPEEFVGLTASEAAELHRKRDIAYLQAP